jgi:hypothetical protein
MENTLIKFSDRKDGEVPWKLKKRFQNYKMMKEKTK